MVRPETANSAILPPENGIKGRAMRRIGDTAKTRVFIMHKMHAGYAETPLVLHI